MKHFITLGRVHFLKNSAFQFFITVNWMKHLLSILLCALTLAPRNWQDVCQQREGLTRYEDSAAWLWMPMALTAKPRHHFPVSPSARRQRLRRSRRREGSIIPCERGNLSKGPFLTPHPGHLLAWETYSFWGKKRHTESSIPCLTFPPVTPVRSAVRTDGHWALGVEPWGWVGGRSDGRRKPAGRLCGWCYIPGNETGRNMGTSEGRGAMMVSCLMMYVTLEMTTDRVRQKWAYFISLLALLFSIKERKRFEKTHVESECTFPPLQEEHLKE